MAKLFGSDPDVTDPEPSLAQLLSTVHKEILEVKKVVLDLQQRQKKMHAGQEEIKEGIEEAPAPVASTSLYQRE
jgi:hypothetical protein